MLEYGGVFRIVMWRSLIWGVEVSVLMLGIFRIGVLRVRWWVRIVMLGSFGVFVWRIEGLGL